MSRRAPTSAEFESRLRDSYALDELWGETMGLPSGDTKEKSLRLVTGILDRGGVAYALIGGVALQLLTREPRTTRDIDLALRSYTDVPGEGLIQAGFTHTGRYPHSDNWVAPAAVAGQVGTVIQFSAEEPALVGAVDRAEVVDIGGLLLRLAAAPDLIVLKLAAAEAPTRRPSKRQHDIGDILALIEDQPGLEDAVPDLRERLRRLQAGVLDRPQGR